MRILAIGSALREVCGDQAALGLTFVEEARTAPKYRLYSLDDRHAALLEDEERGISVPGEIVEIPDDRWEEILASEPPGVQQVPVELSDGRVVTAAFGDPERLAAVAREITEYGGFAAYLRARRAGKA
jgi:allophanate hydrolase-like protein